MRAIWKGAVAFGLVNVPVRLGAPRRGTARAFGLRRLVGAVLTGQPWSARG